MSHLTLSHAIDFRGYVFAQAANRIDYYAWNIGFTQHHQIPKLWQEQKAREDGSTDS